MYNWRTISRAEHNRWFQSAISNTDGRLAYICIDDSEPAGFVSFRLVSDGADTAVWGFYAGPDQPKGVGSRIGLASLDHAFGNLGLRRVFAEVLGHNTSSRRFHLRLGFYPEGLLRQHRVSEQGVVDVHCFGLFKSEWVNRARSAFLGRPRLAVSGTYVEKTLGRSASELSVRDLEDWGLELTRFVPEGTEPKLVHISHGCICSGPGSAIVRVSVFESTSDTLWMEFCVQAEKDDCMNKGLVGIRFQETQCNQ
jgi:RimJ/RimL family protein N-acetyltransferase